MILIRSATRSDLGHVHELICALAEYERLRDEVRTTISDLERALFADAPRVFCELAYLPSHASEQRPVGLALWFYTFSTFRGRHGIWLEDLFVRPEHRGHGVGRELLAHLAKRCVHEDLGRLEWSVLDWNASARRFYESLGALPMTQWIVHRLSDEALQRLARSTREDPGAV